MLDFLFILIKLLGIVIPLLLAVAYFTLAERKILGAVQRRKGPNVVGLYGLFQPLSDGFKLLVKEAILPSNASVFLFIVSPALTFTVSLLGWALIPYGSHSFLSELSVGFLYLFAVSSLGVYGVIMSGWSSNSKYAFLGSLRSTAQMVSYEVSIGFMIVSVLECVGSFNIQNVIEAQRYIWFVVPFYPLFLLFCISGLAETNRHPFDLPEAEAELVSGYNVEYSAMGFALFSLGEYSSMLMMSSITIILFLGGWSMPFVFSNDTLFLGFIWFSLKIVIFVILFVWVRAALPRYRYDQLMSIGWKIFLPISLSYVFFTSSILVSFNCLPA